MQCILLVKVFPKILYATLDLADKEGLGRISMSDIATAIGIKKPSLYNHYASKEELIQTMFTHIREKAMEKMPNDNMEEYVKRFPSEAILYHAIDVYYKWNQESDVRKLNRVIYSEKMTNPIVAQMDAEETQTRIQYFKTLFEQMTTYGKATINNPEFAAKLIVYHMQKLVELSLLGEERLEKEIFEFSKNFTNIFKNGDL